jgi:hypothetical protein
VWQGGWPGQNGAGTSKVEEVEVEVAWWRERWGCEKKDLRLVCEESRVIQTFCRTCGDFDSIMLPVCSSVQLSGYVII